MRAIHGSGDFIFFFEFCLLAIINNACCPVNACICVSVVYGGICFMRVIVYDETKDAMQDARWCYVPTDRVEADRQQQMAG